VDFFGAIERYDTHIDRMGDLSSLWALGSPNSLSWILEIGSFKDLLSINKVEARMLKNGARLRGLHCKLACNL